MLTSPPHPRIWCAYLQFYCINKNDSVGTIEKPRYYGNRRVIRFHWYKRLVFTSNRTDAPDRKLIFSALKRVLPRALEMPERRLKTQRIRGDNERYRFTDSLESYVFEGEGRRGSWERETGPRFVSRPDTIRKCNGGPTSAATSLYHPQFPKCIKRIKFSGHPFRAYCAIFSRFAMKIVVEK